MRVAGIVKLDKEIKESRGCTVEIRILDCLQISVMVSSEASHIEKHEAGLYISAFPRQSTRSRLREARPFWQTQRARLAAQASDAVSNDIRL